MSAEFTGERNQGDVIVQNRFLPYIASGSLLLATNVVSYYEGRRYVPYLDPVGILTVCDGITHDIENRVYTDKECDELLQKELGRAFRAVDKHVKVRISETQKAALASFVYNVGEANFARSTLLKKLNHEDYAGACKELDRWVFAGGKKWKGLINRRNAEKYLCMYNPAVDKKEPKVEAKK